MVIVFIHGIFSSCAVFDVLKTAINVGCPGTHRFVDFEYKYLEPLEENAKRLGMFLLGSFDPGEEVSVVAHSMGGLVSRMALLTADRKVKVRYLIMLATPNHGAVKMSQISGIMAMLRRSVGKIPALYSRSRGLDDLTRVNTIFNDLFASAGGVTVDRTRDVDYVTIPALVYNEDHPYEEHAKGGLTKRLLNLIAFSNANRGALNLHYPHDGIVEEESVRMVVDKALYQSERTYYSTEHGVAELGRNANLHVVHPDLRQANHVEIHSIPRVCELVVALLNADGIDDWVSQLSSSVRNVLTLSNGGLV